LIFKLQIHSDNQYNVDISTVETNEREVKCVQMLVAWKAKNAKPFACAVLLEHTKEFTWNEVKLEKLYNKNHDWLKEYEKYDAISDTWLVGNHIVLKTLLRVRGLKEDLGLDIFISKEEDNFAMKPLCIDLER
jgi:hypothetical protein